MASITINFSGPINTSCQVGDYAYSVTTTSTGGFSVNTENIKQVGQIREITNPTSSTPSIVCNTSASDASNVAAGDFVLFAKSEKVNMSSLLGYFAELRMVNTSTDRAELFSVGIETFESSK